MQNKRPILGTLFKHLHTQVAPGSGDAPGVMKANYKFAFDGRPELRNALATIVFCGPAHFKVSLSRPLWPRLLCCNHSTLDLGPPYTV